MQHIEGRERKLCDVNSPNVREAKRRKPEEDNLVRNNATLQKGGLTTSGGAATFKDYETLQK